MSGLRRLRVAELHPNLLCILCGGYYVDATTIVECLHSFCKTCIVRYLESSKFCPICDVQVHKTKPLLSIRPDKTLQDIVYKLVPGLYQNEMCRRREFYTGHPETQPMSQEDGGSDVGRWYILPDDPVSLALCPAPPILSPTPPSHPNNHGCLTDGSGVTRGEAMPRLSEVTKVRGSHMRYLQCPAGVSVAQLKRLLRAKFGVGPSHPMALLTGSSDDPLNDTLTLVDVAYITSWQRTEPLQLLYRIYERASKKIKLDPDTFSKDSGSLSEDMPKLEPNVGTDVGSITCGSSDSAGNLTDYRCAPLLQAVGVLGYPLPLKSEPPPEAPAPLPYVDMASEVAQQNEGPRLSAAVKQEDALTAKPMEILASEKERPLQGVTNSVSEMIQGNSEVSGNDASKGHSMLHPSDSVGGGALVTYTPGFPAPSNGVNVGIAFVPADMACVAPTAVPCAIVPSEGCIPVSENCISEGVEVPAGASNTNTQTQKHANGSVGGTVGPNSWGGLGPKKETEAGISDVIVPKENKEEREKKKKKKDMEEEGKEVQLKISESGVMSVCGQDTTVEGVINSLQTEACELLSKIESGSLGEDFPVKDVVRDQKSSSDSSAESKKMKLKEGQRAGEEKGPVSNENVNVDCAREVGEKRISPSQEGVPEFNQKGLSGVSKDSKEARSCDKSRIDGSAEVGPKVKPATETREKASDRRSSDVRRSVEQQQPNSVKENSGNGKDGRSSHIPASLTAASLANLNKPHLKAGTSKAQTEEDTKTKEKPSNNGLNTKREGKQESAAKAPVGGCRKSSQPYGYKTLKTPPKSWNPTISRELLVAGKSAINKGNHEAPRTNKFFKVRNAPRFLGNPNTGVRPLYSGTNESNSCMKRTLMSKLDPKVTGPMTVTANNDVSLSSFTSVTSGTTSCVSSVQSLASLPAQVTASPGGALMVTATTSLVTSCASQSNSCTTVVGSQIGGSEADNTVVTSTKASSTLPASVASGTKESTNQSSKVCFNTNSLAENKSESKATHHNSGKTVTNNKPPSNINNSANKTEKKAQQISHSNNSKPEVSGESGTSKVDVKVNSSSAVIPTRTTITHPVSNAPVMMQQKTGASTSITTCITQVKPATVNSLTISNTVHQPPQQLTMAAPAVGVGIIPSCGVTFPAAIGNLPLPCHTSSSISYPTYPYIYQGAEPISLIPPHPSASFIPTFPTCLPHRPALGSRGIGGAKIMPELSLQQSLLPVLPLVSQVSPQTLSPRPMTPPSPRTPTSSQSPRPYPAQSPRQSSTNQSRPVTPQSPKQCQVGKAETQPGKNSGTPSMAGTQSTKMGNTPVQVTQPLWPGSCPKQVTGPGQVFTSTQPSPQSPGPPPSTFATMNTSLRLNASVQTSSSHTLITPKTQWSSVNSSKPVVPQSSKALMISLPGLSNTHGAQTTISDTNRPHTPQSPKSPRPQTPQSPRLSSSAQCTVPQGVAKLTSAVESPRPHTPHSRCLPNLPRSPSQPKNGGNKEKAHLAEGQPSNKRSEGIANEAVGSSSPNPPVITPSITLAPAGTTVTSGAVTPSLANSLGNKFILPQGAQMALPLPTSFASLYLEGVTNALPVSLASPGMSADLSGVTLSPSCNTSLYIPSSNISSTMPFIPFSNSAQFPIPTCATVSVSQPFCPTNTTVSPNLHLLNTKMPAVPINNTQPSKPSGSSRLSANSLANISSAVAVQSVGNLVDTISANSSVMGTSPTPSGAYLPLPCSTVSSPFTVPRIESTTSIAGTASTAAMSSCTSDAVITSGSAQVVTVPSVVPASVTASASASAAITQPPNNTSTITLPTNTTASGTVHTNSTVSGPLPTATTALSARTATATNIASASIAATITGSMPTSARMTKTQSSTPLVMGIQARSPASVEQLPASSAASVTLPTGTNTAENVSSNITTNANGCSSMSVATKSTAATISCTPATRALQSCSPATGSQSTSTMSAATVPAHTSGTDISRSPAGETLLRNNPESVTKPMDLPPVVATTACGLSTSVYSTAVVSGPQSSECFNLCGTVADGNNVVSVKEKGGSEPQLSACTSVCDVTHVIDAKQPCAEQGLSSSGGPRPCLKS
ncbi:mucin-2-like isoform X2 [Penaeus indicus]|uniref:mucin-2-like isoform X2 n=1 Tax=Penaeus indicus TaxID=29960 RepID=UPI00300C4B16